MGEWLVLLQGESSSLRELQSQVSSARFDVEEQEDRYYLRSSEFAPTMNVEEVRELASAMATVLTSLLKVRYGYVESVGVNQVIWVDDDGNRHSYVALQGIMGSAGGVFFSLSGETSTTGPAEAELWWDLARREPQVMDALHFLAEPTTWWSLRKIYDAIEHDVAERDPRIEKLSGVKKRKRVAQNLKLARPFELEQFYKWASHYVHGEQQDAPDQTSYPKLSLGDAEAFVQNLLMKWLRSKVRGNPRHR